MLRERQKKYFLWNMHFLPFTTSPWPSSQRFAGKIRGDAAERGRPRGVFNKAPVLPGNLHTSRQPIRYVYLQQRDGHITWHTGPWENTIYCCGDQQGVLINHCTFYWGSGVCFTFESHCWWNLGCYGVMIFPLYYMRLMICSRRCIQLRACALVAT